MANAGPGALPPYGKPPQQAPVSQLPRMNVPMSVGQMPPGVTSMQSVCSPTKEVNMASLCRIGQETVQEIVGKTSEIFGTLKTTQLPNNTTVSPQNVQERKVKLEENVRNLTKTFKNLRVIYDKVQEKGNMLDNRKAEDLLPIEENDMVPEQQIRYNEAFKYASEEHKDIVEQIQARNHQLKEIIDQLRTIIWEINTMMAMRKV